MRKPASPPTARAENWILIRRTAVIAGSCGLLRLLRLLHKSIRLLVARLEMDDAVRIDDDRCIGTTQRLPFVARAFPVSTPPIAAVQADVQADHELRVD